MFELLKKYNLLLLYNIPNNDFSEDLKNIIENDQYVQLNKKSEYPNAEASSSDLNKGKNKEVSTVIQSNYKQDNDSTLTVPNPNLIDPTDEYLNFVRKHPSCSETD